MKLYTTVEKTSPTALLKYEDWEGICQYYRQHPEKIKDSVANAQHILLYAIGCLRLGEVTSGFSLLSPLVLKTTNSRSLLRRWIISPLASRNLDVALLTVNKLLAADVCQTEDVLLVASHLIKCRHFNTAVELAERGLRVFPGNGNIFALYLRSLTLSEKEEQAICLARKQALARPHDNHILLTCLSYLDKSHALSDKELAFSLLPSLKVDSADAASLVVNISSAVGKYQEAIQAGESALIAGHDGAGLRRSLGQVWLKSSRSQDAKRKAVEHFGQAVAFNPDNLRAATLYADVLIRTGQTALAIPLLERWLTRHPNLPYVRALYARALRQEGQYEAASDEFMRLATEKGITSKWNRYAAAALLQAGKRSEAETVFERYTGAREVHLAETFEAGLASLNEKISQVSLPVERFDWAWEIAGKHVGLERPEWERRAKWGYLADNFLLDWLECRGNQADEPMYRLADIEHVEQFFNRLQLDERGCIIVSAHLGAMYAGPVILSLLDMNCKWVASTPGVIKGGYGEKLISVSDKSEAEVVRACMQTLHRGQSIVIAIDGALNLAAPTIEFHGQHITYSTFSSRLAYKMHLPTVFSVPVWKEGRIDFFMEKMVDPERFESLATFSERWKENYLQCVTNVMRSEPENLRLSGGIWRNIVPIKNRTP